MIWRHWLKCAASVLCALSAASVGAPLSASDALLDDASQDDPASALPLSSAWLDDALRWPDPLATGGVSAGQTYYRFARADGISRLAEPTSQRPLRVWVGGDSLSGGPVYGFWQIAERDPRIRVVDDIRKSSGMVADWYFDWIAYMRDEVAEGPYDVIVLAIGGNDLQRFVGHAERPGEPAWSQRYTERVIELMRAAVRPGRLVVWVGVPPMRPASIRGLPSVVNPLTQAAAAAVEGVEYFDGFSLLAVDGKFAFRLGGVYGNEKIRTQDGIHYTYYGGLVLTEPLLEQILSHAG